jgi:polysaccharide export outer membrane protein
MKSFSFKNALFTTAAVIAVSMGVFAQTTAKNGKDNKTPVATATPVPEETPQPPNGKLIGIEDDGSEEAKAIIPFYSNFLSEYRLGPNDVISVEVFGQCPDYCKTGVTVPPTARISYPLVREGVMVGGKTVTQVADEITKRLNEYIIDPVVTVTLEKAMSARYSVLGKVVSPGVRVLDRKVSVYEAVVESGGVAKDADKKKVYIFSYNGTGRVASRLVNLAEIESGKADMIFLNPGDQVFVSGKGFTWEKVFKFIGNLSAIRYAAGSPL